MTDSPYQRHLAAFVAKLREDTASMEPQEALDHIFAPFPQEFTDSIAALDQVHQDTLDQLERVNDTLNAWTDDPALFLEALAAPDGPYAESWMAIRMKEQKGKLKGQNLIKSVISSDSNADKKVRTISASIHAAIPLIQRAAILKAIRDAVPDAVPDPVPDPPSSDEEPADDPSCDVDEPQNSKKRRSSLQKSTPAKRQRKDS